MYQRREIARRTERRCIAPEKIDTLRRADRTLLDYRPPIDNSWGLFLRSYSILNDDHLGFTMTSSDSGLSKLPAPNMPSGTDSIPF
jgi:hypothetical protein